MFCVEDVWRYVERVWRMPLKSVEFCGGCVENCGVLWRRIFVLALIFS